MQTLRKRAISFLGMAVDTILPPRCVVTGEMVERQGMIAPGAWRDLDFITSPFCACCGSPFEFAVDEGALCASCIADPPPFETARSALKYNDTSRSLILGFKHADQMHAVKAFLPWMTRAGAEMLTGADYLVPVPLHRTRLIARRYNQAGVIAGALGREAAMDVLFDGLLRVRATPSQGHLSAKERRKNVRKAFAVNPKYVQALQGKSIVLIDDVYTTGATLKECTEALLKAGAGRVDALTLARVVKSS